MKAVMTLPPETSERFSVRGSNVSRTLRLFAPPPTPSKPTTPETIAEFGRQRLNDPPTEPAAPTPARVGVPIVLIVTPFEPVPVIG